MTTMAITQRLMSKEKELEDLEEQKFQQKNCIIRGSRRRGNLEVFLPGRVGTKLVTFNRDMRVIFRKAGLGHQHLSILALFALRAH